MKKVPVEVHRTSGNQAHFVIPAHLDAMEVRGIIESVMEQLMLEDMKSVTVVPTYNEDGSLSGTIGIDWNYKHDGD